MTGPFARMMRDRFVSTNGATYNLAIAEQSVFAKMGKGGVRKYAIQRLGWQEPPAEIHFLLRQFLTNKRMKQMGLSAVWVMAEPFEYDDDIIVFSLWFDDPGHNLEKEDFSCDWGTINPFCGFAFLVPDKK